MLLKLLKNLKMSIKTFLTDKTPGSDDVPGKFYLILKKSK